MSLLARLSSLRPVHVLMHSSTSMAEDDMDVVDVVAVVMITFFLAAMLRYAPCGAGCC
jgi:hypothetical protein